MINSNFKNLIENTKEEFIGYGNPGAEILIIGKECAIDPENDKDGIYELSITRNREQWRSIINNPETLSPDNILSWFSPCSKEEKFSPLFPFKGQLFTIRRKDRNGNISNKGTSATWYKYQKLTDKINDNSSKAKDNEIDFLEHCFITEFSAVCSPYSRKSSKVAQSIKDRTENLLNHPFFTSFPIIIVACGPYIDLYKINLQELFDIEWDKQTIRIEGTRSNWYNLHKGKGKILIHTNQLSMNISDKLLVQIANECRSYKRK